MLSYERKLKQREDTLNDLERDDSYFRGKNYFGDNGMQVSQKYFDVTWGQEGLWRSKSFFNQHLFFNHTNVNSVSNEKYPGKPTGVKFLQTFFYIKKTKIS